MEYKQGNFEANNKVVSQQQVQAEMVIGITSHRDLPVEQLPLLLSKAKHFFLRLQKQFPDLPLAIMSPLAEGGSRAVAKLALELGLRLIVPLPMPAEVYKEDFIDQASRLEFDELCKNAQIVELPLYQCQRKDDLQDYSHNRNLQYAQNGCYLSDHSHILLTIWDGHYIDAIGGTSQIIQYRRTGLMKGISSTQRDSCFLLEQHDSKLIYQITCSRQNSDKDCRADWCVGDSGYLATDEHLLAELEADSAKTIEHIQTFNQDCKSHQKQWKSSANDVAQQLASHKLPDEIEQLSQFYQAANGLANLFSHRVHRAMISLYSIAIVMGVAFILYGEIDALSYLVYVYVGLFFIGYFLFKLTLRHDWYRKYLDYRALAEGLRIKIFWKIAGVCYTDGHTTGHENYLQKQDIELAWVSHVLSAQALSYSSAMQSGEQMACDIWIGTDQPASGQIGYFRQTWQARQKQLKHTEMLNLSALLLGIFAAVLLAIFQYQISEQLQILLLVLMGVLPLFAGLRQAYSHQIGAQELVHQYRYMERLFTSARIQLDLASDAEAKRIILKDVGVAALDEHAEWILMQRVRPLEQSTV